MTASRIVRSQDPSRGSPWRGRGSPRHARQEEQGSARIPGCSPPMRTSVKRRTSLARVRVGLVLVLWTASWVVYVPHHLAVEVHLGESGSHALSGAFGAADDEACPGRHDSPVALAHEESGRESHLPHSAVDHVLRLTPAPAGQAPALDASRPDVRVPPTGLGPVGALPRTRSEPAPVVPPLRLSAPRAPPSA